MPEIQIEARDLNTLTVEDIEGWRGTLYPDRPPRFNTPPLERIVNIRDEHNLTDERLEKLTRLVREANKKHLSSSLNAAQLSAKLQHIVPRPSPPSSIRSVTLSPSDGDDYLQSAYICYNDLKAIGGRPSREINPNAGPLESWHSRHLNDPDINPVDRVLWHAEFVRTHMWLHGQHEDMVFQEEFIRWKMFCEYREIVRASPTRFAEYKEGVRKFLHHRAIEWTVELQEDLLIQSKLDEWKEYYIYVCGKLQERRIREAEKQVFCCRKELKAAKANGLHNANFSSWHDPQRLESALKELKAALSNGGDRLVKEQDKQDTKLVLNGSVGTDWDWLHEARRSWNPPYNVLEQMKGEFPKILAEMELTRRDQAESPNSKRSSSGAVSKAAQPRLSQRDTRHRGKRSILQAVLEPVRMFTAKKSCRY